MRALRAIVKKPLSEILATPLKPKPQVLGQLPKERVTPDVVFDKVGVDYAGPVYIKQG